MGAGGMEGWGEEGRMGRIGDGWEVIGGEVGCGGG